MRTLKGCLPDREHRCRDVNISNCTSSKNRIGDKHSNLLANFEVVACSVLTIKYCITFCPIEWLL